MTDTHKRPDLNAWYMDWEQIERDTLIRAAAHNLLKALQALVRLPLDLTAERVDAERAARAAIIKATGGQS